jgi:hypothetical protein
VSVRSVRKRLVRATLHQESGETKIVIVPTEKFRLLSHARVMEDKIEKSIYFRPFKDVLPGESYGQWAQRTYRKAKPLGSVDKLLREPGTKFIRGNLSDNEEIIFFTYTVSEASFIATCLSFPLSNKYVPQIIVHEANDFYAEDRFNFAINFTVGKWCLFVNEIPEAEESKKPRDNDLFWAKFRFA